MSPRRRSQQSLCKKRELSVELAVIAAAFDPQDFEDLACAFGDSVAESGSYKETIAEMSYSLSFFSCLHV